MDERSKIEAARGWGAVTVGVLIVAMVSASPAVRAIEATPNHTGVPSQGVQDTSELEEYPGFRRVNWKLDEEIFAREEAAREELTRQCMDHAGMPYVPVLSVNFDDVGVEDLTVDLASNENDRYVETLSHEDRKAYFLALYGVVDPFDPALPNEGEGRDCAGSSFVLMPGVYALHQELAVELDLLKQVVRADQAYHTADEKWVDCMELPDQSGITSLEDVLQAQDRAFLPGGTEAPAVARRNDCDNALMAARNTVRLQHENTFAGEHREALEKHREKVARWATLADTLLGG